MKTWWGCQVQRVTVVSSKSSWWWDNDDVPQESVLGPTRSGCFRTWHSAMLPCMAYCLGTWFLAGWTTKVASCKSPIGFLQEFKWTVSGNHVSVILAKEAAERIFFAAKMHWFLLMHSSPSLYFGKTKIKHSWIPEQWAKVGSRRILHFHCNLAIPDLGLNTSGTVPRVLIRFALICSSSRLGGILTVGLCLLPEWSFLCFREYVNCSFNSVLMLKTMPVLLNLGAFSGAEPWPCSGSADWNALAARSRCKVSTKRICCFCGTSLSSCKWKWFIPESRMCSNTCL